MDELQSVLKELDQEYGFADLPDGVYHVRLGPNSKLFESDGRTPSYRVGWVIQDGEYSKREVGDFLRWFPSDPAKAGDREQTRIVRGQVTQFIQAVASVTASDNTFTEAVQALRAAANPTIAAEAIDAVVGAARGADIFVRLVTSKPKDPTKKGYQNVRYMEKGAPVQGVSEAELAAIQI